ncbi:MAG: hypothetical protein A3C08_01455 [Candidatus Taylorbacteria bacterium RIFCSPHIGHO2_02_FULL_47_18]|uniref:Uncharacterized protein n=1 Tax=Candidatus Taylorbacteria bacterium RIFCSPLOWO2_01_FULL_48_100 TaxID=1802322 RepID=A0A1G2NE82_9BACT|nr:MAG: hypothetical protein A2670_01535 [Candidatus Taylorbacteria bacterium RIFCSPHIGHO2_01_FULL_48_38]OHA28420.1 MAG: hypothetical protein A3C08_01455 [Candidatus Taylorbacteria bacterium RIFCSPHIGHO2_02_FULL_47_18]OHA34398.1 MAG: hypothetical protein A2938_00915 [Candidatus Taylorbacteria bacterium RIFCSPLOWO2_01_FULL_48_100]OHA40175.1 MAG: hypothetical protein A3J31_01165 [Candidatus Taylorbacteria bacterium RIFCSPLOWO2_02_FULL_48_16]OHA45490.1 MAG: hypothetical protein A3H13_01680 [Candid
MAEYIESVRRDIMRRVYVVFFVRKVVKPFVIKMGSVAALAVAVAALVSVQNVLGNMPSPAEFVSFGKFIFSAFANTELSVQALSLAVAVLAAFAVRDLARVSRLIGVRRVAM